MLFCILKGLFLRALFAEEERWFVASAVDNNLLYHYAWVEWSEHEAMNIGLADGKRRHGLNDAPRHGGVE